MAVAEQRATGSSGPSFLTDERTRAIVFQVVTAALVAAFLIFIVYNTSVNLEKRGIASGFGFLTDTAGFDVAFAYFVEFSATSSYGMAFVVGLVNTLVISAIGIVLATILGFTMGIARLSPNWLIAKMATVYIEAVRNIPLLLQILFWYFGVLAALPKVRQSLPLIGGAELNNRGLYLPQPIYESGFWIVPVLFVIGIVVTVVVARWANRRQMRTGQRFPVLWTGLGLVVGLPVVAFLVSGMPISFTYPVLKGFNMQGGMVIRPEFMALLFALAFYTGAFIAEIVRSGILAVSHGQTEAANALGLRRGPTLRLIIIPQAMRVIVPPLTSEFLNLTKNSSLAVAIGYPDLVGIFAGTVLNQTGQAVEVIFITMLTYLAISLLISLYMNWYNKRIALVER